MGTGDLVNWNSDHTERYGLGLKDIQTQNTDKLFHKEYPIPKIWQEMALCTCGKTCFNSFLPVAQNFELGQGNITRYLKKKKNLVYLPKLLAHKLLILTRNFKGGTFSLKNPEPQPLFKSVQKEEDFFIKIVNLYIETYN